MTPSELDAIRRIICYGVVGDNPGNVSGATVDDVAEAAESLLVEVDRLRSERSAVIDALNLYADDVAHDALTSSGLLLDGGRP
jgi:hypothetical protein